MNKIDMNLRYSFYFIVPLFMAGLLLMLFSTQSKIDYNDYAVTNQVFDYNLYQKKSSHKTEEDSLNILFLGNSYVAFKEAIAFKESQGNYAAVNTLGYLGKYQFGVTTLDLLGIKNPALFLKNPALQEKAFLANAKRNKWVLRRDIKRFVGKKIDGIRITESGILAAAHLAGPGSVKLFLRSYGVLDFTDAYGTDIPSYMRKFSGYDTAFITPLKKSRVNLFE
ncbi:peptidoglycan-binding protein LysM [Flavobacteriaceae bacterium]|nr:peptidoglycan-binding protein LysM [Flavobacteriaceae bacterium]MDC1265175.1 peptidoglycan-binding protein LysM [Flavobacteriaceae bacterium]